MRYRLSIILLFISFIASARDWQVQWGADSRLAGTTGQYMPFWARTGEDGILPVSSSGLITIGADLSYRHSNGIFFEMGVNLAGALATKTPVNANATYAMLDRLYVSGGWKMLHLDLGMKPRQRELSDLSISGGNVMYSRNARNIPGINAWSDWIYFEKGHWVGVKGNIAHYQYVDNRYVDGAYLHNKSVSVKVALGKKFDLSATFEHWAQWGGNSPDHGLQPSTFKDFMLVFMAGRGGEGATMSDQINVLGNHLGKETIRADWKHDRFTMSIQYDKPFEDSSGMKFQNAPDGIWSLQFAFNDRSAAVTDLVVEFVNTTWQSGTAHDRPATEEEMAQQDPNSHYYGKVVIGGCDNYFGNGEYKSGWTNYGRTMGLPLILAAAPGSNGEVTSFVNTRLRAFHAGLKGNLAEGLPYMVKGTYSVNYGIYGSQISKAFDDRPWQLSLAFEVGLKRFMRNLPLNLHLGVYGDVGCLYQNCAGLTLRLSFDGVRKF